MKSLNPSFFYAILYDADGNNLKSDTTGTGGFSITAKLEAGQTYYLSVWHPEEDETAELHLQIFYTQKADDFSIAVYDENNCGIYGYAGSEKNLTIPSELAGRQVVDICEEAFKSDSFDTLILPDSLRRLQTKAFSYCYAKSIKLPSSLEVLPNAAFQDCSKLVSIEIPGSIKTISQNCFRRAEALESVILHEGLENIEDMAFYQCASLKSITIPSTVKNMGSSIFVENTSLKKVVFRNSMDRIPDNTFQNCERLDGDKLTWPLNLTTIGEYAFYGCVDNMGDLVIPEGVTTIEQYAFRKCECITELTLPSTLRVIGKGAFQDSDLYCDLILPVGVEVIKSGAFMNNAFSNIYIPSSVTKLEEKVFSDLTRSDVYIYNRDLIFSNTSFEDASDITFHVYKDSTAETFAEREEIPYVIMDVKPPVLEDSVEVRSEWDDAITSDFVIYEAVYEYVRPFSENYATVYKNGVFTLLDEQNNQHYSAAADSFGNYSENMLSLYDASTNTLTFSVLDDYAFTLEGYSWAGDFCGGKCSVKDLDGKYGLIDKQGQFLLNCEYDGILYDETDTVLVCRDSVWTAINPTRTAYAAARTASVDLHDPAFSKTGMHIIASDGNAYGILTTDHELLTDFIYDRIYDANDGLFTAYRGSYVDLIDLNGTVAASLDTSYAGEYSEGKLAMHNGTDFAYIDRTGKELFTVQAEQVISADAFHDGYAVIQTARKGYSYIDTKGKLAVDSWWDYAARFAEGYALVMNTFTDIDGNVIRQWSILDRNFNIVKTLDDEVFYDETDEHCLDFSKGYIRTIDRTTGLMGIVNLDVQKSDGDTTDCRIYGTITSYGSASGKITVKVHDAQGIVVCEDEVENSYTFTVPSGEYSIRISKNEHFTETVTVHADGSDECIDITLQLIGDVDNNHVLDENDIKTLKLYFAGYPVTVSNAADADCDGVLTRKDVMILARYLNHWQGYLLPY